MSTSAAQDGIGVLYPDVRDPYRGIFKSVMKGIDKSLKSKSAKYSIDKTTDTDHLKEWVDDNSIRTVVTLGTQSLQLCQHLNPRIRIVVGAVISPPQAPCNVVTGITLSPAPAKLFSWLKRLAPGVKNVTVLYTPDLNEWLIDYARLAAKNKSLTLNAVKVTNLQQAATVYREMFNAGMSSQDAIWLPQDPHSVDQSSLFAEILKESWNQYFVVFSSNPSHVKRGILFGLYPDYQLLGFDLGGLARKLNSNSSVKNGAVQPLNEVLIAVNLRTAEHLKLNLKKEMGNFNLTFPALK